MGQGGSKSKSGSATDLKAGNDTANSRPMTRKERKRSKKLARQESKRLRKLEKEARKSVKKGAKTAAKAGNSLARADLDAANAENELKRNQTTSDDIRNRARARSENQTDKNKKQAPVRPPPPTNAQDAVKRAEMMAQDPATQWMQVEQHRQASHISLKGVEDDHTRQRGKDIMAANIAQAQAREAELKQQREHGDDEPFGFDQPASHNATAMSEVSIATNLESAAAKERLIAEQRAEEERRREQEEANRRAKEEQERVAREEAEAQAQRELEAQRLKAEAEAKRAAEEEAARKAEAERLAREKEDDERRQREAAAAQREVEEQARREAEEKAKREAEEKAKREAEEKAKREAEEKAKREAEEKAKREAEEKAKREAEEKAKREAEEKAKREAEEEARRRAEDEARIQREREEQEKARLAKEAEEKKQAEERARQQREEAERRVKEEQERREREAEAKRQEEEARKQREREEAEQRAKEVEAKREAEKAAMAAREPNLKPSSGVDSTPVASPFGARLRSVSSNNLPTPSPAPKQTSAPATPAVRPTRSSSMNLINKFGGGSQSTGASPAKPADNDNEYEELDRRAVEAAEWVNKEIRKLIGEIQRMGVKNAAGRPQITYGPLFVETANTFEALSGTLKTAKKYKVVEYEGELLYQGASDNVMITLLQDTFDGVVIKRRKKSALKTGQGAKSKGFETSTLQNAQQKCHICTKTVYPMEFVGAAGKAFHKNCFRCLTCKTVLKATNYCCTDDSRFYCKTHYMAAVNAGKSIDDM